MEKQPIVINLVGGPGIGKSQLAHDLTALLKKEQINCEYIPEYAKTKAWEKNMVALKNQIYIFAKQQHHMYTVGNQVDVMICDTSMLFSIIYGELTPSAPLYKLIIEEFNKYNNLTFLVEREFEYDPVGRYQDEEAAILVDNQVENLLNDNNIYYENYCRADGIETILEKIKEQL